MNLQEMTLPQLKEIVNGAPEGANSATYTQAGIQYCIWSIDKITQKWDEVWGWHNAPEFYRWPFIKLSDIRARIDELEPAFKVGDRVVWLKDEYKYLWKVVSDECEGQFDLENNDKKWHVGAHTEDLRHATPEEIAAGHRIDEPQTQLDNEAMLFSEPMTECELVVPKPEDPLMLAYKEIAAAMRTSYEAFKTTADLHQQGRADGLEDALLILEMHFERLKGEQGE